MFKKFFLCSLIFISSIHARIIETDDINEVLHHVYDTHDHQKVLVVFDLDNTIGEFKDGFGGDEWFSAIFKQHINMGKHPDTSVAEILPLYLEIQKTIWMEPVQTCTPNLIWFLQDVGISTMALTSRSFTIINRTLEQLHHMNIDFSHTALHADNFDLTLRDVAHYRDGIIFCGQNDKGQLLVKFFEAINYKPEKVIFVDDKMKYVEQVEHAMDLVGIPCIGIRYSHLDEKVANYNLADHEGRLQEFCLKYLKPGSLVLN